MLQVKHETCYQDRTGTCYIGQWEFKTMLIRSKTCPSVLATCGLARWLSRQCSSSLEIDCCWSKKRKCQKSGTGEVEDFAISAEFPILHNGARILPFKEQSKDLSRRSTHTIVANLGSFLKKGVANRTRISTN
jgi:hypothetical protein